MATRQASTIVLLVSEYLRIRRRRNGQTAAVFETLIQIPQSPRSQPILVLNAGRHEPAGACDRPEDPDQEDNMKATGEMPAQNRIFLVLPNLARLP